MTRRSPTGLFFFDFTVMGRGEGGHVGGVTSEASDSDVKPMLREVYLIINKGPPM